MNEMIREKVTKTTSIRVRLTNEERQFIRELAAKEEKTMSALIRERLLCYSEEEEKKKDD
jgi:predicted DNA-binding protein